MISPPDNRSYTPIHTLNDDALLNIFYIYQLIYGDISLYPDWDNARWWYKLTQVCRRWRYLILASPVRLGLHLVCTYGTPVAEMLAHSPPFPLIINFLDNARVVSTEDEGAILFALQCRDRVRRIGLSMPALGLVKVIKAMDGQFPVLERLFIWPWTRDYVDLMLPKTFQAPHLVMLSLSYAALSTGSPLLTTTIGLTLLALWDIPLSAYFHPSNLVAQLSSLPLLENISIGFKSPIPAHDVEEQPFHTFIGMLVALPNLRMLFIRSVSAYLDGLLARISTPLLEVLQIRLFNQLSFTATHLFQFISRTECIRFSFARLTFSREVVTLAADRQEGDVFNPFDVEVGCRHIDWQVSIAAQIFNGLMPVLSVVEGLALRYEEHDPSSERSNETSRTQWRDILRPFNNVKVLYVAGELIGDVSCALQLEDGELPLELVPELKELVYYQDGDPSNAFTSFTNARQIAGCPVFLINLPSPPTEL